MRSKPQFRLPMSSKAEIEEARPVNGGGDSRNVEFEVGGAPVCDFKKKIVQSFPLFFSLFIGSTNGEREEFL